MPNPLARVLARYAAAARLARGDVKAGASAARLAERLAPRDPAVVRELAERDRAAGRSGEGERRLRSALAAHPEDLTLRSALGAHLSRSGKSAEALALLERAVVDAPGDVTTRLELAAALAAAGRYGDAEAHVLAILATRPRDRELRAFHAHLLHRLRRPEEARGEFERAFELGSSTDRAHAWRAVFHAELGEKGAAAETLRQGLDAHPRSTRLLGDYARFLSEQGGTREAEELLRRSLAIHPADPLALATLGSLLSRGGGTDGEVYFRYALSIEPGHAAALAGLFKVLERGRRDDEILTAARGAAADPATTGAVLALCAQRFAAAGLTDEAKRALEAAAERSPADPDVALTMADWLLDREGNGKDADAWYARALANAVDGAAVTARVAAARLRMGRADEADELAEKALTLDGRCAEALSVRSGVLTSRGRLDEALAVRRQALQIDPENAAAHLDAADLLARLGREDDARIEIQVASGLDPRGALLLDYVEGLLTRENAIFAESFLADLVKVGYGGARGRFVHAHVLAAVGRGDEARSHLAAALEAAERSALDSRLLRESRRRLPDREFARLAGGA